MKKLFCLVLALMMASGCLVLAHAENADVLAPLSVGEINTANGVYLADFADLKNCGPGQAGTITAGKFLAHFAKETPYIHLDIAGVAYFSKKQWYYAPGASGFGIRLLYAFIQMYEGASKGKM